jgi:hypothetical protein
METSPRLPTTIPPAPSIDLELLAGALSHVARWKILRELSLGEPREIRELSAIAGCSYDSAIKHVGVLVEAGLAERGRGKTVQVPKKFISAQGERTLDFGHCLLRLDSIVAT